MSLRTLKDRFKSLSLRRRKILDSNDQDVRVRIQEELHGPGCLSGYRSMWHIVVYCWHDGYDKLKPDEFSVHGCIGGCSRKVI